MKGLGVMWSGKSLRCCTILSMRRSGALYWGIAEAFYLFSLCLARNGSFGGVSSQVLSKMYMVFLQTLLFPYRDSVNPRELLKGIQIAGGAACFED